MDKVQTFYDLSKLLTGLPNLDRVLAEDYLLKLTAKFEAAAAKDVLQDVLDSYAAAVGSANVLPTFLASAAAVANKHLVKQIVNIWLFSQFSAQDKGPDLDAGFYERGAVWDLIKAHPPGFSHKSNGYWAIKPA